MILQPWRIYPRAETAIVRSLRAAINLEIKARETLSAVIDVEGARTAAAAATTAAAGGGQREGQIRMVIIVISARWEDSWEVPLLSSLAAVSNIGGYRDIIFSGGPFH